MAVYENQSDMFTKRAVGCKKSGDMYYAKAMAAKSRGDLENYKIYMAQAQNQYNIQKENEAKAIEHKGKTWR